MTTDAVTTRSPGRPRGSTIKRLSAVIRARYGIHNDLPLDILLATMEYWSAKTARLVDAEADAATPTVDENGKQTPSAEEIQRIKSELSDAFEQLTKAAALCTPYFHAKLQNIELGGEIDLGRLSYDELSAIIPLLRKAQALAIEDRSDASTVEAAAGRRGSEGEDGQQPEGSGSAASVDARPDEGSS